MNDYNYPQNQGSQNPQDLNQYPNQYSDQYSNQYSGQNPNDYSILQDVSQQNPNYQPQSPQAPTPQKKTDYTQLTFIISIASLAVSVITLILLIALSANVNGFIGELKSYLTGLQEYLQNLGSFGNLFNF